jgi:hypothetical protein
LYLFPDEWYALYPRKFKILDTKDILHCSSFLFVEKCKTKYAEKGKTVKIIIMIMKFL